MTIRLLCIAITLYGVAAVFSTSAAAKATPENDHLVPVPEYTGSSKAYRNLCRERLVVTPADVASFMQLPGSNKPEMVISLYQDSKKIHGLPGDYWMTVTKPSLSLFKCIPYTDVQNPVDPGTVNVQRCDAPVPRSTAIAIHKLWKAMLEHARPVSHPERYMSIDSVTEVFSVKTSAGTTLEGESPKVPLPPKANADELAWLAVSLADYCELGLPERAHFAQRIEQQAAALLKRASN